MSELKAGYWRDTPDGMNARTIELFAERDGKWYGRCVETEDANWWEADELGLSQYLGPTLPPDPGPGCRLLRKLPEPEAVQTGDEYGCVDVSGVRWVVLHVVNNTFQHPEFWYRRRVTPSPPQPPDGWELLPDGTPWQAGFKRYSTGCAPCGWHDQSELELPSGPIGASFHWYARRIEPTPVWVPTDEYRADITVGQLCGHETVCNVPVSNPQRKYVRGGESEWRDVGVQE